MELLFLSLLLAFELLALLMMGHGFVLSRRPATFRLALQLMRSGAWIATFSFLLILTVPGTVPWWDYAPSAYWSRLALAFSAGIAVFLFLLILGRKKPENLRR